MKVTCSPLLNRQVRRSVLNEPVAMLYGRHEDAAASVVFQQLLEASQLQSRGPELDPPHADRSIPPRKSLILFSDCHRQFDLSSFRLTG